MILRGGGIRFGSQLQLHSTTGLMVAYWKKKGEEDKEKMEEKLFNLHATTKWGQPTSVC